jgi:hypothetical protein
LYATDPDGFFMYNKGEPQLRLDNFGATTFELG